VIGDEGEKADCEKDGGERGAQRVHFFSLLIRRAYLPLYKVAHALIFIDDTKSVRTDTQVNFKRKGRSSNEFCHSLAFMNPHLLERLKSF